jgi:hypothetical protein
MWLFSKLGLLSTFPWKLEIHNPNPIQPVYNFPIFHKYDLNELHYVLHAKSYSNSPLLNMIRVVYFKSLLAIFNAYNKLLLWAYHTVISTHTLFIPNLEERALLKATLSSTGYQFNILNTFVSKGTFLASLNQFLTESGWNKSRLKLNFYFDLIKSLTQLNFDANKLNFSNVLNIITVYFQIPGWSTVNESKSLPSINNTEFFFANTVLLKELLRDFFFGNLEFTTVLNWEFNIFC